MGWAYADQPDRYLLACANGSLVLSLTLRPGEAGTARLTGVVQGLVAELLRWRRYCRVEGGPELRDRMAEEIQAMAVLYG